MVSARILVISDTHLRTATDLPVAVLACAEHADHVVHAGDHSTLDIVHVLGRFTPVTAVHGNIEDPEVFERLPRRTTVEIAGVTIGVVHDAGPAQARHERLEAMFPGADVVVYGHTHEPEVARTPGGTWVVNPGSSTQRRTAPFHSLAWVTVGGSSHHLPGAQPAGRPEIDVELVNLDAPLASGRPA